MIEQFHTDQHSNPPSSSSSSSTIISTGSMNTNGFWCHVCQRKFCSSSALFQHGKRLSHLKRAMKMSASRFTTITNGKVTSSSQRPDTISIPIPIPIVQPILPPPPPPAPSSASSCTSSSFESILAEPITIRKQYHTEKKKTSYTCQLCNCRCWSIRNIHRHLRLHADVRPFHCNRCQMKFKSYANLFKHFKTSRHQANEGDEKQWSVDTEALEEQKKLISQVLFSEDTNQPTEIQESETNEKDSSSIAESDNLLEDLHIPDSRLIDGDAAELALIDPNTFEELHKAAECLLNLQGVFYFGEEEHGADRSNPFSTN